MSDVIERALVWAGLLCALWVAPAAAAPADEAGSDEAGSDEAGSDEAGSDEAPPEGNATPRFLHTPASSATAGQSIVIRATVEGDWQLAELALRYRVVGQETWQTVPVQRAREGDWIARIPAEAVNAVGLDYYLESRGVDGVLRAHFASAEAPHPVRVFGDSAADTERDQLARYRGLRSRVRVEGLLVAYGSAPVTDGIGGASGTASDRFSDRLWQAEAEYIYRPLTWLHDLRFGFGLMRGAWPAVDETPVRADDTPGLNYGYAEINVELHRWFSLGGRLVLGATGVGFTAGIGGVARIGDINGTHFATRLTTVGDVGTATDLRFHWNTVPRVPMSLGIEFTDWPAGETDAANLAYTAGFEIDDRWTVTARVGTTGRTGSFDGGFQAGLGMTADF